MDISETKDDILVKAELPGMEARDVDVSLSGEILTIKGEKKKETEKKDEHKYYSERYYGSYMREFRLPAKVQEDRIEASFDKGVLSIRLPKIEEARKKQLKSRSNKFEWIKFWFLSFRLLRRPYPRRASGRPLNSVRITSSAKLVAGRALPKPSALFSNLRHNGGRITENNS